MRTDSNGTFNNLLLPGTILLANIDLSGLLAYGIKAALGGAIWLGYKVIADRIEREKKRKEKKPRLRVIRGKKDDQ